jgi:hypothetical protein
MKDQCFNVKFQYFNRAARWLSWVIMQGVLKNLLGIVGSVKSRRAREFIATEKWLNSSLVEQA